jgi:hypothetical protein
MKPHEKAEELTKKFGIKALEILENTFEVWNIKRDIEIERINNGDENLRGLKICNCTLSYWTKVKNLIQNEEINKHGRA